MSIIDKLIEEIIVVIDAGHGGKDPGALGYGLQEKDITLKLAKRVQELLKGYKVKVLLTRAGDTYPTLTDRSNFANKNKATVFISIHVNAGGGKGTGYETFIYNGNVSQKTKDFQTILTNEIYDRVKPFGVKPHGTLQKTANYAVLRETNAPAVLTENLFIDNENDATLLKKADFLEAVAQGHAQGLIKALGLVKTETPTTNPQPTENPVNGVYKVLENGKQTGAYKDPLKAVEQAVNKGVKDIELKQN